MPNWCHPSSPTVSLVLRLRRNHKSSGTLRHCLACECLRIMQYKRYTPKHLQINPATVRDIWRPVWEKISCASPIPSSWQTACYRRIQPLYQPLPTRKCTTNHSTNPSFTSSRLVVDYASHHSLATRFRINMHISYKYKNNYNDHQKKTKE